MKPRKSSPGLHLSLVLLLTCSACAGLSPEQVQTIEEGNQLFESGNSEAALEAYKSVSSAVMETGANEEGTVLIRIGRCLVDLGRVSDAATHLQQVAERYEAGDLSLSEALVADLFIAQGDTQNELGRRSEPTFLSSDITKDRERQGRSQVADEHYDRARGHFIAATDSKRKASPSQEYEANLGLGYAYLRKGILAGKAGSSAIQQAERILDRIPSSSAPTDDPRLSLYRALVSMTQAGGVSEESYRDLQTALSIDADLRFHEIYCEVLQAISRYEKRPDLDALPERNRQQIESLVATLRSYSRNGFKPTPPWNQWEESYQQIALYVANYDEWEERSDAAAKLVLTAERLLKRGDGSLDTFRPAYEALAAVEPDFQSTDYREFRRDVQTNLVEALIDTAKKRLRTDDWGPAKAELARARSLCDREYLPNSYADFVGRCAKLTENANDLEKIARGQDRAREALGRNDAGGATNAIADLRQVKAALIGTEYANRVGQDIAVLQRELDRIDTVSKIEELLNRPDKETLTVAQVLDLSTEAFKLADTNDLDFYKAESARRMANCHFSADKWEDCVTALDRIPVLFQKPEDKIQLGTCYYKQGEEEKASTAFRSVSPDRVQNVSYSDEASVAAARSFIDQSEFRLATRYTRGAKQTELIRQAQLEANRGLLAKLSATPADEQDPAESIEICKEILELAPQDHETHRILIEDLVKLAKLDQDEALYADAYQHMKAYQQMPAAPGLSPSLVGEYSNLVACFENYVPLQTGAEWVYGINGSKTNTLTRRVTGVEEGGRYVVSVKGGSEPESQIWIPARSERQLRRIDNTDRNLGTIEELPVGRAPFQQEQPEVKYRFSGFVFRGTLKEDGKRTTVPAGTFENCIVVEVKEDNGSDWDRYTFAPGVGEILYESSRGEKRELLSTNNLGSSSS